MDRKGRTRKLLAMLFLRLIFLFAAVWAKDVSKTRKEVKKPPAWRGIQLKYAEAQTLQEFCPPDLMERKGEALYCAVDAAHVFIGRDTDPDPTKEKLVVDSFPRAPIKELGKNHFQMGKLVFFKDFTRQMENADFATFNELEEENESGIDSGRRWAYDDRNVYCAGQVVTGLSPKGLAFWPFLSWDCKDLVSAELGNALPTTGYIKDSGGVFVYVDCKLHKKVPEADPETFAVPNNLFPSKAKDGKGHIYNCGNLTARKKR